MEKQLAETAGSITILKREPASSMPDSTRAPKRASRAKGGRPPKRPNRETTVPDGFYRNMVWSLVNGVIAITREGRVAVMNETAYRVLGLEPADSDIGRPFTEILRDQPDIVRILGGAFNLSTLPNRAELRLKSTRKVIGYTLSHIDDGQGQLVGATLFFKDLTRVEQLEERERLRDRLAALGEMAAAIAHEVKNPLAGIEVNAGILRRRLANSPDAQASLADIINEAKMANAIVQDVLEFVRPIRLQMERVSLDQVIRDAVSMAESHVHRGGTTISARIPQDLPPIQGDGPQLRQLFTNLLTNAFEALEGTGTVEIIGALIEEDHGTADEPRPIPMILVEIVDNGPGVPRELADKVFSPFFTTKAQGSGLGLAIVRKIVDAHDGRIDLSTRPGGGACFRIVLPLTSSEMLFA
jgi:two-component system sensor histidine kinase AtoS